MSTPQQPDVNPELSLFLFMAHLASLAAATSPVNDDINYSPCLDSHALSLRSLLSPSSSKHNAVNFLVIHHAERGFSSQSVCLSVCITQKRTISKYSNSL